MKISEVKQALEDYLAHLREKRGQSQSGREITDLGNKINDIGHALRLLTRSLDPRDFPAKPVESNPGLVEKKEEKAKDATVLPKKRGKGHSKGNSN